MQKIYFIVNLIYFKENNNLSLELIKSLFEEYEYEVNISYSEYTKTFH